MAADHPTSGGPAPGGPQLAYLIVAHHQPDHLARLIRALGDDNSYFFIHIDAKAPLDPFRTTVPDRANVVFLSERIDIQWGRLSVVQAILALIRAAVASGHRFRYFTLLSGSDYPIKPRQEIQSHLAASDAEFLRIDRKLTAESGGHAHFIERLPQGRYFGDLSPYHGSMYWSLTAECIRSVLAFVDTNPGYIDIHEHMYAPDEVFFHTLIKQSPFAAEITQDFSDGGHPDHTHHANHFIDWAGIGRADRRSLILDEGDLDALLASTALFARKFDEGKSSRLLDLVDAKVHAPRAVSLTA